MVILMCSYTYVLMASLASEEHLLMFLLFLTSFYAGREKDKCLRKYDLKGSYPGQGV